MVDRFTYLEQEIRAAANDFPYPKTPHIAGNVMLRLRLQAQVPHLIVRKLVWAMVFIVILVGALMLVPPVRAAVLEWIQIGAVRILPSASIPTPSDIPEGQLTPGSFPVTSTPDSIFVAPTVEPATFSLLNLAGETTLAEAQTYLSSPILVPAYPKDLGLPDRVYLQDQGGPMLVLIWLDPANTDRVRLSLHTLTPGSWGIEKFKPQIVQQTSVNGQPGVWVEGPYFLQLRNRDFDLLRLIEGHVLIWTQGSLTYRLETDMPLEEAIRIAESLTPIPASMP